MGHTTRKQMFCTREIDIVTRNIVEIVEHDEQEIVVEVSGAEEQVTAAILDLRPFGLIVRDGDPDPQVHTGNLVMNAFGNGNIHVYGQTSSTVNISYGGVNVLQKQSELICIKVYVPADANVSLVLKETGRASINMIGSVLSLTVQGTTEVDVHSLDVEKLVINAGSQSFVRVGRSVTAACVAIESDGQSSVHYNGDTQNLDVHARGLSIVNAPNVNDRKVRRRVDGLAVFRGPEYV